jgi:hypothetical protein
MIITEQFQVEQQLNLYTITNKGSYRTNNTGGSVSVTTTNLTLSNSGWLRLDSTGTLSYTNFTWDTSSTILDRGGTFTLISGGGALTVPSSTILIADYARTFTSVTLEGLLTHTANSTAETYKISYTTSGSFTISASGSINVSHLGYQYSDGPGQGGDSGSGSGGGGYGGAGGNGIVGAGGAAYGSSTIQLISEVAVGTTLRETVDTVAVLLSCLWMEP